MKTEKVIKHFSECLHPVMILSLAVPSFYLFYTLRSDSSCVSLYLAGFLLLICSAAAHFGARRAESLAAYLAVSVTACVLTCLCGRMIGSRLFEGTLLSAFLMELRIGCLWLISISARVRMREKGRQKAKAENDISWKEDAVSLEKPSVFGILCYAAAYTLSLLNRCPAFCDAVLWGCICYLTLFFCYRHATVTEAYFLETGRYENVPRRKIRRLRFCVLGLVVMIAGAASLPAVLTRNKRIYHDLRYFSFRHIIPAEELSFPVGDESFFEQLPEWTADENPPKHTPELFRYLDRGLPVLAAVLLCFLAWKAAGAYSLAFRGIPEENGDVSIRLEQDDPARKILKKNRGSLQGEMTEQEIIRKKYRQTIRRYRGRKNLPGPALTPSQIEDGTAFPEGFDRDELHRTYEKARYGGETRLLKPDL